MLIEIIHTRKDKYYAIPLTCDIQNSQTHGDGKLPVLGEGGRVGSEEFHFGVMKHSVEGCQWWLNNMNVHEASDYMLSDG